MKTRVTRKRFSLLASVAQGFMIGIIAGLIAVVYWRIRLRDLSLDSMDVGLLAVSGLCGSLFSLGWDLLFRRRGIDKPLP